MQEKKCYFKKFPSRNKYSEGEQVFPVGLKVPGTDMDLQNPLKNKLLLGANCYVRNEWVVHIWSILFFLLEKLRKKQFWSLQ